VADHDGVAGMLTRAEYCQNDNEASSVNEVENETNDYENVHEASETE